jgi:low affinity Fe/Cu permease
VITGTSAIHAKLDEIIIALNDTRNEVVRLEHEDSKKIEAALKSLEEEAGKVINGAARKPEA